MSLQPDGPPQLPVATGPGAAAASASMTPGPGAAAAAWSAAPAAGRGVNDLLARRKLPSAAVYQV